MTKDPVTSLALVQWLRQNRAEITARRGPFLPARVNLRLLRFLVGAAWKMLRGRRAAERVPERAVQQGEAMLQELRAQSRGRETLDERLAFIRQTIGQVFIGGFEIVFHAAASSTYMARAAKLLAPSGIDPGELAAVERAVPHSVTTEMGMQLLNMARQLDAEGCHATADSAEMRDFLAKYGHRNTIELDVGIPSWNEDPRYVVDLINSYLANGTYREGLQRFAQAQQEAEAAIPQLADRLARAGYGRRAKKLARLLRDFRAMFGVRELSKFYLRHALSLYREQILAVGAELAACGRLNDPKDVFFLTLADLASTTDLKITAHRNREAFRRDELRNAPRLIASTGESLYTAAAETESRGLQGIPVSPGAHEGTVKILEHPEEGNRLEEGDVLVTAGTNPAWTPLFLKLGALIMETGGPISHGSVVAREYGLPAVAGVAEATQRLREGQRVRVNGQTGRVDLLDNPDPTLSPSD